MRYYVTAFDKASNAGHGRLSKPLIGPFDSEPAAREHVSTAAAIAERLDPFNWFLAFGVTGFESDAPGLFNASGLV